MGFQECRTVQRGLVIDMGEDGPSRERLIEPVMREGNVGFRRGNDVGNRGITFTATGLLLCCCTRAVDAYR